MPEEFWVIKVGETYLASRFVVPTITGESGRINLTFVENVDVAVRYTTDVVHKTAKYLGGEAVEMRQTVTPITHVDAVMGMSMRKTSEDPPSKATEKELPYKPRDFGWALVRLKAGTKVYRRGWNGKGQYIQVSQKEERSKMTLPYIYISTVQGDLVPWLASQTDMLADDWEYHSKD